MLYIVHLILPQYYVWSICVQFDPWSIMAVNYGFINCDRLWEKGAHNQFVTKYMR